MTTIPDSGTGALSKLPRRPPMLKSMKKEMKTKAGREPLHPERRRSGRGRAEDGPISVEFAAMIRVRGWRVPKLPVTKNG